MPVPAPVEQPIQMALVPQPDSAHLTGWRCTTCGDASHRGYTQVETAREYGATHAQVCSNDWSPTITWTERPADPSSPSGRTDS